MATCPKCSAELGLRTSFALAQFWSRRPVGGFNSKIEFACHRCGTILTYRYELAGLFAVLALLPVMVMFPASVLPKGWWSIVLLLLWVVYVAALCTFFSHSACPMIANPPIEGE